MANNLPDNAFTSRQALDPGLHRGVKFPASLPDRAPALLWIHGGGTVIAELAVS